MSLQSSAISIQGIEELVQKFNQLPQKVEVKILRQAVNGMGETMLAEVKSRAFVADQHSKRGALRHTKRTRKGGGHAYSLYFPENLRDSLELSNARKSRDKLVAEIRGNFYAKFLEFGSYGHPGYHPFIRPSMDVAADSTLKSALDFIIGEINKL